MFLNEKINIRLREQDINEIEKIVYKSQDIESVSHFVRIAVLKEIRRRKDGII